MRIPRSIRWNGTKCKVYQVDEIDDGETLGQFDPAKVEIWLLAAAHVVESTQAETLLHECAELINWKLGLELTHLQLTAMASGLFGIIRDNKLNFGNNRGSDE